MGFVLMCVFRGRIRLPKLSLLLKAPKKAPIRQPRKSITRLQVIHYSSTTLLSEHRPWQQLCKPILKASISINFDLTFPDENPSRLGQPPGGASLRSGRGVDATLLRRVPHAFIWLGHLHENIRRDTGDRAGLREGGARRQHPSRLHRRCGRRHQGLPPFYRRRQHLGAHQR